MSDDPETARQIAELARSERPLLVLDVDDVLLEFIRPFPLFLKTIGYELRLDSFRLGGNIYRCTDGLPADRDESGAVVELFYARQTDWQELVEGAADALDQLGADTDIVMLTAMPHRHRSTRRTHLDRLGLHHPLITTETEKGPAVASLRGSTARRVAFVDDQPRNLASVQQFVPDAALFHLMADSSIRPLLPPLPAGVIGIDNWSDAVARIGAALKSG